MTNPPFTDTEMASWLRFRFMVEETSLRVSRELAKVAGISGGQFGILNILSKQPSGELRQQKLADLMRWDRTRLSHQLTRMRSAGLVIHIKLPAGTLVRITDFGVGELDRIRPALESAVRTHFFDRLSVNQLDAINDLASALRDSDDIFDV